MIGAVKPRTRKPVLVYGYGNPGRMDDGLGPEAVECIEAMDLDGVYCETAYQLNIEDASTLAEFTNVLFVDASKDALEPFEHRLIEPSAEIAFTSHSVSPESVLAICEEHFNVAPRAAMLAIRGYEFDFEEGLSRGARENLNKALFFVESLVKRWKD